MPKRLKRRYFQDQIRRRQVIGLRFAWNNNAGFPNPARGSDWQIVREVQDGETLFNERIHNKLRNKFVAVPLTDNSETSEDKTILVCFSCPSPKDGIPSEWLDCQGTRFYKP